MTIALLVAVGKQMMGMKRGIDRERGREGEAVGVEREGYRYTRIGDREEETL